MRTNEILGSAMRTLDAVCQSVSRKYFGATLSRTQVKVSTRQHTWSSTSAETQNRRPSPVLHVNRQSTRSCLMNQLSNATQKIEQHNCPNE
ncbi:hypothetical protein CEE69_11225 [Rhodopirellula bahusiensis]|uniref:Uncharacterized protein n=1 Tax=Rhodopirellula bahusiensis TaxID=2014065 RepID=A0A2G1W8N0_9BACT|nr:hypothetical protein CEE69_11225 [Rhodopirellula bahusiensis]